LIKPVLDGILDVGCGVNPIGKVNTDINAGENWEIRQTDIDESVMMDVHSIPNFIVCSGEYLPFRDNSFEIVSSHHVIEHVVNPSLFLRECRRVSNYKTVIVCPHRYGRGAWGKKARFHRHVFSSLSWSATRYSFKTISRYHCIPHELIPLIRIPEEFTITYYKRGG